MCFPFPTCEKHTCLPAAASVLANGFHVEVLLSREVLDMGFCCSFPPQKPLQQLGQAETPICLVCMCWQHWVGTSHGEMGCC